MKDKYINYIFKILKNPPLINEPMSKHTTFGIGGNASCYVYPSCQNELQNLLLFCNEKRIPVFFTGSGSNILVSDQGFDGVIVSLRKTFKSLEIRDDGIIRVESGVMLGKMVKLAIKKDYKGLESLIGVPGTIGGALIMNAGAYGSEISNYFDSAEAMTMKGKLKSYSKQQITFSYRNSTFPKNEILVSSIFKCVKGNKDEIKRLKLLASKSRKINQPLKYRSAGSIFKNPNVNLAAGRLIDEAGLKGLRSGNAQISLKHANFIINLGDALAEDVLKLIKIIQKKVEAKFNIRLKLEIKLLGFPKSIKEKFANA